MEKGCLICYYSLPVQRTLLSEPYCIAVSGAEHQHVFLQLAHARSIEQQAQQQAQQSTTPQRITSGRRLTDTLRGFTMRVSGPGAAAGRGAGALGLVEAEPESASAAAAATPVPEKATKSVAAHDGGCFTCAFDRSELAGLESP